MTNIYHIYLNAHCPVSHPNAVTCHPMYTHADTYFSMFYRDNSRQMGGELCRCLQQWALLSFWNAVCSLSNQPDCLGIPMANNTIKCNWVLVPEGTRQEMPVWTLSYYMAISLRSPYIHTYMTTTQMPPNVRCLSPYFLTLSAIPSPFPLVSYILALHIYQ